MSDFDDLPKETVPRVAPPATNKLTEFVYAELQDRIKFAQKLLSVMKAVKRIPKNGYNSFGKYYYVMEADVMESIRDILAEAGIVVFWSCISTSSRGVEGKNTIVAVTLNIALIDAETGYTQESQVIGEAGDSGDKAIWKAYTGAFKYFLLKTFLISSGDDPENDEEETHAKTHKTQTASARPTNMEQAKKSETEQPKKEEPEKLAIPESGQTDKRPEASIQDRMMAAPDIKAVNELLRSAMMDKALLPENVDELNKLAATRRTQLRKEN